MSTHMCCGHEKCCKVHRGGMPTITRLASGSRIAHLVEAAAYAERRSSLPEQSPWPREDARVAD